MEAMETRPASASACRGYGKPPWRFKGSALYQLHLVKSEIARALIPKEFRLVEAFGYTLGGFFLANYNDSPAGAFDELVVIAGTVWNPPTSYGLLKFLSTAVKLVFMDERMWGFQAMLPSSQRTENHSKDDAEGE